MLLAPDDDDERSTLTFSRFGDGTISIAAPSEVLTAEELEALFEADFDTPEAIRAAIAELTDEERECLRGVVGDEAFAEFEAGVRVPHDEEMNAGDVCFTE